MAHDVRGIVARLGLEAKQRSAVEAKASEYVRIATARLGAGGLGQGELCKGAACVELACMTALGGVKVDASLVARLSSVNEKVYRAAKAALQKILGVTGKATARDLCIQFGCARHDASVRAALAAYKERFVRSLPTVQQGRVDFGRPVFLAAAFYLVARKNKVAVDRTRLLDPLGVTASEFAQACASMSDLCADLVGLQPRKRRAEELPQEQRALIDRTGAAADDDVASSSDEEVEDDGQVGYRINAKKQQRRDYEEWKQQVLAKPAPGDSGTAGSAAGVAGGGTKKRSLTEKKLRQVVLSFAAGSTVAAAAGGASSDAAQKPLASAGRQQEAEESSGGCELQPPAGPPAPAKVTGAGSKGSSSRSNAAGTMRAALRSKNS
ncbi:hypothetical protein D9Q98_001769 [Chlorella vulgaris]|uniref:ORC6 second cyclin-like domain-containing protein n=1 Tax=Chlorella vulgaris TaxID=3077 RepID=A0A9D4TVE2_CHLVU|nr:hypothetical protein D9Q98_001769 [Chlorella vulgaris]